MAACKVKPYELVDREVEGNKSKKSTKKVMMEDGDNLIDPEKEKQKEAMNLQISLQILSEQTI